MCPLARSRKSDRVGSLDRALVRLFEAERQLRQRTAARLGIGVTDLDALFLLEEAGALAAGRIAEALGVTTGAVTGLVDRLERAGWVERTRHETDRRQVLVALAQAKREALDAHRSSRKSLLLEALSAIDDASLDAATAMLESAAERLMQGAAQSVTSDAAEADGPSDDGSRAPVGQATRGRLRFVAGAPNLELRAGRFRDLYRATFGGRPPRVKLDADGTVTFQYKRFSWFGGHDVGMKLALTSTIPWSLEFRGGIAQLEADLRELHLLGIDITGGASACTLRLPRPRGHVVLRVTGGANQVKVKRPRGSAAQAIVRGGANSLTFDAERTGALGSTARFATAGWGDAEDRWSIELTGGASDLSVTEE